ncbi:MAG: hypothetical protein U0T33_08320 [Bacteroidales bacterium]
MDSQDLEKGRAKAGRISGFAGTTAVHLALFLLLIFMGFTTPPPQEKEMGILVNFGTDETGSGLIEPSGPPPVAEAVAQPVNKNESQKKDEKLLSTDNDNEAPKIKKTDPDAEKKKKERIEAERIRKAELEAERVKKEQEEAERRKIELEQKRTSDITNRTKNAFANGRNSGTNSTGEGITGGEGNQGDPNGSVNSKIRGTNTGTGDSGNGNGIGYDLGGRTSQHLEEPKYDYQGEGKVVVEINVDRNGNVVSANPGVKGSSTLDEILLSRAKEAALKSKFKVNPDAPAIQKGTITYNFILR